MIPVSAYVLWSPDRVEGTLRTESPSGEVYTRAFSLDLPTPRLHPTPVDIATLLVTPVIEFYQTSLNRHDRNLHGWSAPYVDPQGDGAVFQFEFDS